MFPRGRPDLTKNKKEKNKKDNRGLTLKITSMKEKLLRNPNSLP